MEEIISDSEVIVIGNKDPNFADVIEEIDQHQKIIDLVRITEDLDGHGENYDGICW